MLCRPKKLLADVGERQDVGCYHAEEGRELGGEVGLHVCGLQDFLEQDTELGRPQSIGREGGEVRWLCRRRAEESDDDGSGVDALAGRCASTVTCTCYQSWSSIIALSILNTTLTAHPQ